MKINRFVALAAIALLVVGAMGAVAIRTYAQSVATPAAQATDCPPDTAEGNGEAEDANEAGDLDCGENEAGDANENESDPGNQANDTEEQEAAPSGAPAITADEAQQIAEDHLNIGPAKAIELEMENGVLVYGVEFDGQDVKVDANTGEVLYVETGQD